MKENIDKIVPLLKARTGPAIIYVTRQKQAEDVAQRLKALGLDADVYHAGLAAELREKVQVEFMESEKGIVCATIAFGMGIDKGEPLHTFLYSIERIDVVVALSRYSSGNQRLIASSSSLIILPSTGHPSVYAKDFGEL